MQTSFATILVFTALVAAAMAGGPQERCVDGKKDDGSPCVCPQDSCIACIISDKASTCTACAGDTPLVGGRCVGFTVCHKRKTKGTGEACQCPKNCMTCQKYEGGAPAKCVKCTNSKHLHQDTCVDACPEHLAAHGHKKGGRMCADPFLCFNSKANAAEGAVVPAKCRCPDKNCQRCEFRAGETGTHCIRCQNNKYLVGSQCRSDCTSGLARIGIGAYGRMCAKGYYCKNKREVTNNLKCVCQTPHCELCQVTAKAEQCMQCNSFKFLYLNECVDTCPVGSVEQKPASGIGSACLETKI